MGLQRGLYVVSASFPADPGQVGSRFYYASVDQAVPWTSSLFDVLLWLAACTLRRARRCHTFCCCTLCVAGLAAAVRMLQAEAGTAEHAQEQGMETQQAQQALLGGAGAGAGGSAPRALGAAEHAGQGDPKEERAARRAQQRRQRAEQALEADDPHLLELLKQHRWAGQGSGGGALLYPLPLDMLANALQPLFRPRRAQPAMLCASAFYCMRTVLRVRSPYTSYWTAWVGFCGGSSGSHCHGRLSGLPGSQAGFMASLPLTCCSINVDIGVVGEEDGEAEHPVPGDGGSKLRQMQVGGAERLVYLGERASNSCCPVVTANMSRALCTCCASCCGGGTTRSSPLSHMTYGLRNLRRPSWTALWRAPAAAPRACPLRPRPPRAPAGTAASPHSSSTALGRWRDS